MSLRGDFLVRAEDVFGFVVAVDVGGDEIDRHVVALCMCAGILDPRGLRGGRTADAQARADALHALRGVVVELEVRFVCFGLPAQKSMFGSFQTSKYHCETSSMP